MRRALIAILAVLALPLAMVAPAGAQEELGFEINPTAGSPGDVVTGLVDPADVAEHCTTDLEAFQARFAELLAGPFGGGGEMGELFDRFFPGGTFVFESYDQVAYSMTGIVLLGLSGIIGPEPAQEALPQTFVLTFADIETQEPVGERSTFDPNTGFGQVTVPDVDPGLWAVAAACVGPSLDLDVLEAGIRASGAFLQELGFPLTGDVTGPEATAFMQAFLGSQLTGFELLIEFLGAIGPDLLEGILVPDAQGTQTFCVDCEPPPSQNLLDQFCGVLPGVQAVPDRLAELFGGVDINDPSTFPSVDAIEAFVNEVSALLEQGDTSVPPTVQPQWTIATAELRELVFGLTAVGFDFALLVDLSPEDADRILEVAGGEGPPDPEFDAAVEVLTAFFVDNCVPPEGAAPAATPTQAVVRFTG